MTRRPRRNHSPAFKAKVALAAVKGEKTQSQGDYYSRGRKPLQRIGAEQEADRQAALAAFQPTRRRVMIGRTGSSEKHRASCPSGCANDLDDIDQSELALGLASCWHASVA